MWIPFRRKTPARLERTQNELRAARKIIRENQAGMDVLLRELGLPTGKKNRLSPSEIADAYRNFYASRLSDIREDYERSIGDLALARDDYERRIIALERERDASQPLLHRAAELGGLDGLDALVGEYEAARREFAETDQALISAQLSQTLFREVVDYTITHHASEAAEGFLAYFRERMPVMVVTQRGEPTSVQPLQYLLDVEFSAVAEDAIKSGKTDLSNHTLLFDLRGSSGRRFERYIERNHPAVEYVGVSDTGAANLLDAMVNHYLDVTPDASLVTITISPLAKKLAENPSLANFSLERIIELISTGFEPGLADFYAGKKIVAVGIHDNLRPQLQESLSELFQYDLHIPPFDKEVEYRAAAAGADIVIFSPYVGHSFTNWLDAQGIPKMKFFGNPITGVVNSLYLHFARTMSGQGTVDNLASVSQRDVLDFHSGKKVALLGGDGELADRLNAYFANITFSNPPAGSDRSVINYAAQMDLAIIVGPVHQHVRNGLERRVPYFVAGGTTNNDITEALVKNYVRALAP